MVGTVLMLEPNAWVASLEDEVAEIKLEWTSPKVINKITVSLDTDFDHPMETSIWGHPERIMPFVVQRYQVLDHNDQLIHQEESNHQTRNELVLETPVETKVLKFRFHRPSPQVPIAVFGININ